MSSLTISSPAKLNLALEITGKRPDGFHDLRTVFERIDLADTLTFSAVKGDRIHLTCSRRGVPCNEQNLVYRVAMLLRQETGIVRGVRIDIEKRIPVAAGLAGGSSNAAAALTGLNRFWRLGLSTSDLIRLSKKVGSDVAFFLHDVPFALGTGRGDKIRPLSITAKFWHVLVVAQKPLLTKDVYGAYASCAKSGRRSPAGFTLTKAGDNVNILCRSLKNNDVPLAQESLFNDLEAPIVLLRPALLKLKKRLQACQAKGVCFSGSGPSIFALTTTRAQAEAVAARFRGTYKQVFVVRTR